MYKKTCERIAADMSHSLLGSLCGEATICILAPPIPLLRANKKSFNSGRESILIFCDEEIISNDFSLFINCCTCMGDHDPIPNDIFICFCGGMLSFNSLELLMTKGL